MRRFAVVHWVNGEDAGMYSEVRTDAIRQYDDTKMSEDGHPHTENLVAVEWKKGKKPKHGWPVYSAYIKFVSNNRYYTSKKIKQMRLEKDQSLPKKRASESPARYSDSEESAVDNAPTKKKRVHTPTEPQNVAWIVEEHRATTATSAELLRKIKEVEEEKQTLRKENEQLKTMLFKGLPDMIKDIKTALKAQDPTSSLSSNSEDERSSQTTQSSPPEAMSTKQVEICPGTNVCIDLLSWAMAQNASSSSCFVRALLTAVFPKDVLLRSSLRGTTKNGPHYPALDKAKVEAIYRATLQKWPHVVPSTIGVAINAKLTELRWKKRQRPKNS
ncbi:uncharacterized protein LOC134089632 [Sardina pilchardus]|uniref:uncharacterized protein LOC134089632 n=1 Tax=Sardina pilchardus TaxID=27697 RepID=UPI002E162A2D